MICTTDNTKNVLNKVEALLAIQNEKKITIMLENVFTRGSDTEDVFRGLYSDQRFEESEECLDAMEGCSIQHTFFLTNDHYTKTTAERLILDGYWTTIILNDQKNEVNPHFFVAIFNDESEQKVFAEYEMAQYLTELGYKVYEESGEDINQLVLAELAINEGFEYNEALKRWLQ